MKRIISVIAVMTVAALVRVPASGQERVEGDAAPVAEGGVDVDDKGIPAVQEPGDVSVAEGGAVTAAENSAPSASGTFGRDPRPSIDKFLQKHFVADFELVNMFQYANDTDFDRSQAEDDSYGQSSGMFGTYLKPKLTVKVSDFFKFYWELEVGLDLWSRNSADAVLGNEEDDSVSFGVKQRELYGEILWQNLSFRLGYQRIQDVSGLFLNHWFGAGAFRYGAERGSHIRAFGGQMPDQTFEGWDFTKNSLQNDVYVAGVDGQWVFNPWVKLVAGVYYLGDLSQIDYFRHVGMLTAGVAFEQTIWDARVAVVGQFGTRENAAADGSDSWIKAWGLVADGGLSLPHFELRLSGSFLSADDDSDGNDSYAFMWSGKRPGMSILLSENEMRDVGTNIDERISSKDGGFYDTAAGLAGLDLALYYKPINNIKIGFVTAALMALNPDNALGGEFVGSENELVFEASLLHDLLKIQAVGGVVVPGKAGGALLNRIDLTATDNIYFGQLCVGMYF